VDYGLGLSLVTLDGRPKMAHNGAMLGLPPPNLREEDLPSEAKRRFVGTRDIGVFPVRVVEGGGRLRLEMPRPGPTTALLYLGNGEFAGESGPDACRPTFSGGDGPSGELRLFMGAIHWYGVRLP